MTDQTYLKRNYLVETHPLHNAIQQNMKYVGNTQQTNQDNPYYVQILQYMNSVDHTQQVYKYT